MTICWKGLPYLEYASASPIVTRVCRKYGIQIMTLWQVGHIWHETCLIDIWYSNRDSEGTHLSLWQ